MNELRYYDATGNTLYAIILSPAGLVWNGSAFEALVEANWATYDVALAESGTTKLYFGTFPAGITAAANYDVRYYRQAGVTPDADLDTFLDRESINWNGIAVPFAVGYDYTAWPGTDHLTELLEAAGVTLRAEVSTEQQQALLDAIVAEVALKTRQQFVTSIGIRYFDGSGTPEMDIDAFVELDLVRALWSNTTGTGLTLNAVIDLPESGLPNTRIAMYRGGLPTLGGYLVDRFPAGRGNVEVTATWGYAATIPADLWEAVAMEASARLVDATAFSLITTDGVVTAFGPVISWRQADMSKTWASGMKSDRPSDSLGWHSMYQAALKRYTRTGTRQARKMRPAMV
jgi:hypothetical protein